MHLATDSQKNRCRNLAAKVLPLLRQNDSSTVYDNGFQVSNSYFALASVANMLTTCVLPILALQKVDPRFCKLEGS